MAALYGHKPIQNLHRSRRVMKPQANPFGRKSDEMASIEEILASLNKAPPHSIESEQGLISCLLQDPDNRISEASMSLPTAAFYHEANRTIYEKLLQFYAKQIPIDPVMVTDRLRREGLLERVGGASAITELFTFVPSPSYFSHYKQTVLDDYRRRLFIHAMGRGIKMFQDSGSQQNDETLSTVVEQVREIFSAVEHDDGTPDIPCIPIKQLVHKAVTLAAERAENPGRMMGVSYGFTGIDQDTSGIQTGQFITVLGPSSSGKSLLARQIVESWCAAGHAAVIYTWEMQDIQETTRLLCSQGKLSNVKFKSGKFTRGEQDALAKASKTVSEWPIDIVDCGGRYIEDVWRDIQRRVKRLPPGVNLLAEIDYLQLAPTRRDFSSKDRQKQIAFITNGCKQEAKKSKRTAESPPRAVLMGLSQVNKDGDAREAEDIINDSDVAIKILPRKVSEPDSKTPAWKRGKKADEEPTDTDFDLFIAKNRDGKRYGKTHVRKFGSMFRFEEVQPEETPSDED